MEQFVGQRIGNYRILRQLGEGGMGVVYEGLREDIGSRAAIKVLRPEYAMKAELAARFFNEARAANLIEHPGIVKIFDYGQLPSGAAYLAMEYLAGESLHTRLTREKRLSEADTIRIGRQVAMALAAAHAKKVIHRDLKPENIILVPDIEAPSGERAKILDFGIAKLAREHRSGLTTDTSVVMGTPIYMSPEQCKGGKTVGDRADVYALGVMLFEMLSGRTPFIADEPGEYIGMHLFKDPPPIGSLVENLMPKLRLLIDTMLLKDAQKRPAMGAVAMVLRDLSNVSTDVKSMAALLAEGNLDDDTLQSDSALGLAKTESALPTVAKPAAALPVGSLAKPLPAIRIPAALKQPAVALSPLSQGVDALAKTQPDRDRAAVPAAALEQTVTEEQPPTAVPPPPLPPPTSERAEPERGAAPGEPPTVKGRKVRAPAAPAGAAADSNEAVTQRPAAFTPAWQQVQIVTAGSNALESLDTVPPSPDPDELERSKKRRSLGKQLRRLRFRLKKRVYGWFGVNLTDQRSTPARTTSPGQYTPIYALSLLAVVVIGAAIWWRRASAPQPATPVSGQPIDREKPPVAPPGVEMPSVEPEDPTPMPEAIAPLPDEVKAYLTAAKEKEDEGNVPAAYKLLRAPCKKLNHPALWSALGRYACQLENAKGANEALSRLSPETPLNARDRQKLIRKCEALGLLRNESGLFEPRN